MDKQQLLTLNKNTRQNIEEFTNTYLRNLVQEQLLTVETYFKDLATIFKQKNENEILLEILSMMSHLGTDEKRKKRLGTPTLCSYLLSAADGLQRIQDMMEKMQDKEAELVAENIREETTVNKCCIL